MALRQDKRLRSLDAGLELGVSLENELANAFLSGDVGDRTEQCEAPAFAVDRVLPGGERYVSARSAAALPDRKADQFQTGEHAVSEARSASASFSGRVAGIVLG
jgi:hypothetical protein